MLLTAKQVEQSAGSSTALAIRWYGPLRDACARYNIDTPERLAAFMAQVGHESASLTRTVENLNYSANGLLATWPSRFNRVDALALARNPEAIANRVYGGRLGNTAPGDGWLYRGRGLIQITGKANYGGIRDTLRERVPDAPDFVVQPQLLEAPKWAAMSAAAFWDDHDLNNLADIGDFRKITTRINGGQNGAADRNARYAKARRVFGVGA